MPDWLKETNPITDSSSSEIIFKDIFKTYFLYLIAKRGRNPVKVFPWSEEVVLSVIIDKFENPLHYFIVFL